MKAKRRLNSSKRRASEAQPRRALFTGCQAGLAAWGDAASIQQIVQHLVANAIDASAPDTPVQVIAVAEQGRVRIDVIDQGKGMTPTFIRDELFKPFVSTKEAGFGLGAFEALGLAQAMGGTIEVASEPGRGSNFTLWLPLAEAHSELDASEQEIASLKKQLAEMELLKDRQAVAELKATYHGNDLGDVIASLSERADAVRTALSALRVSRSVELSLLSDHYEKPYRVMSGDRDEFEEATRRGLVEGGPFFQPVWSSQKMRRLKEALREIDDFAARQVKALEEISDTYDEVLIEPFTQDFWEAHYF